MKRSDRRHHRRSGFTLLELVIVLAILALVTTLAFRSMDQVEDQRRYEASREMLAGLEKAVLGEEQVAGFVSDMGRLPNSVLASGEVTLAELWSQGSLPTYDVRSTALDSEVLLPAGWRGPYLTLPIDATNLLDGWGNAMSSPSNANPANPTTTGYHRLRDANDAAIIAAGEPVSIVRHLGASGAVGGAGIDYDWSISFVNRHQATVKTAVDFKASDGSPAQVSAGEKVTVRVFAPDASNATALAAYAATTEAASVANSVSVPEPTASPNAIEGATIGQRAVRAYLYQADGVTLIARSAIKHLTLRPGVNFITLTIYRP